MCQPRPRLWSGKEQPGGESVVECLRRWCLGGEVSLDSGGGGVPFISPAAPEPLS